MSFLGKTLNKAMRKRLSILRKLCNSCSLQFRDDGGKCYLGKGTFNCSEDNRILKW